MFYGLPDLLFSAVEEFSHLASNFLFWVVLAIILSLTLVGLFVFLGKLVRTDWWPVRWIGGFVTVFAAPVSFATILLLPASSYLQPTVIKILDRWEKDFLNDSTWNQESFRQQYWSVRNLKKPDGTQFENFTGYPPPEDGGGRIPASHSESQAVIADIDSRRVADHFQDGHGLLARLLWTKDRPIPDILRNDMEIFFREHPGTSYDHSKAVQLAGNEMQKLLEEKIGRIVLSTRVILASLLLVLWLPLYGWAMYDAWKKLEPST